MRRACLLLVLPLLALAACGSEPADAPVAWMQAKPNPVVGSLEAAVVERLGPDRVLLEARWGAGTLGTECQIDLGLPAGVMVLEGEERIPIDPEADPGHAAWVLQVPMDMGELDAVVRYCVQTPEGMRAAQCAVRLTPAR